MQETMASPPLAAVRTAEGSDGAARNEAAQVRPPAWEHSQMWWQRLVESMPAEPMAAEASPQEASDAQARSSEPHRLREAMLQAKQASEEVHARNQELETILARTQALVQRQDSNASSGRAARAALRPEDVRESEEQALTAGRPQADTAGPRGQTASRGAPSPALVMEEMDRLRGDFTRLTAENEVLQLQVRAPVDSQRVKEMMQNAELMNQKQAIDVERWEEEAQRWAEAHRVSEAALAALRLDYEAVLHQLQATFAEDEEKSPVGGDIMALKEDNERLRDLLDEACQYRQQAAETEAEHLIVLEQVDQYRAQMAKLDGEHQSVLDEVAELRRDNELSGNMLAAVEAHAEELARVEERAAGHHNADVQALAVAEACAANLRIDVRCVQELAESLRADNKELLSALEQHKQIAAVQEETLVQRERRDEQLQVALEQRRLETEEAKMCAEDAVEQLKECAAENGRLRTALQERLGRNEGNIDVASGFVAENEELRAALQRSLQDVEDSKAQGAMEAIKQCAEEAVASLGAENEQLRVALEQSHQDAAAATRASEVLRKRAAEAEQLQNSALWQSQQETAEMKRVAEDTVQGLAAEVTACAEAATASLAVENEQLRKALEQSQREATTMKVVTQEAASLAAENQQLQKALEQSQREVTTMKVVTQEAASLAAENEQLQKELDETQREKATMKVVTEEAVGRVTSENEQLRKALQQGLTAEAKACAEEAFGGLSAENEQLRTALQESDDAKALVEESAAFLGAQNEQLRTVVQQGTEADAQATELDYAPSSSPLQLAECWASAWLAPSVVAESLIYLERVPVVFSEFMIPLENLVLMNAHQRVSMIQEIQSGRSMRTTLAVYKEFDTASEGYLVWSNGEIRDFVVTCFEHLALRPPADADVALFFEHFDPDRRLMLDVHECLCIVDAMLRSVFLGTQADVGAGHEALRTELTLESVTTVAVSGASNPPPVRTSQAGPETRPEFEPRARVVASTQALSPAASGRTELSAGTHTPEQPNSLAPGITPAMLQAQQAQLERAVLVPQAGTVLAFSAATPLQHSAPRLFLGGGIAAPEQLLSGSSYQTQAPVVISARTQGSPAMPAAVSWNDALQRPAEALQSSTGHIQAGEDLSDRWATDPPGLRLLDPSRVMQKA